VKPVSEAWKDWGQGYNMRSAASKKAAEGLLRDRPDLKQQLLNFAEGPGGSSYGTAEQRIAATLDSFSSGWDGSSIGGSPFRMAFQYAVEEEFGVAVEKAAYTGGGRGVSAETMRKGRTMFEQHRHAMRAIVRAQYKETQRMFAERGIKEVTVFRGTFVDEALRPKYGKIAEGHIPCRALMSTSYEPKISMGFGSYRTATTVPVDQVFTTAFSGAGVRSEGELVLIGGRLKHFIYDFQDAYNYWQTLGNAARAEIKARYPFAGDTSRNMSHNWPIMAWLEKNGVLVP